MNVKRMLMRRLRALWFAPTMFVVGCLIGLLVGIVWFFQIIDEATTPRVNE